MKRLHPLLMGLLLLSLLMLTACSPVYDPLAEVSTGLAADALAVAPRPEAPDVLQTQDTVTLYFRYLDEPLLAQETRTLSVSPDQSHEKALIAALIAGPDVQSPELTGLFPAGVKVLSTLRQGRTLFVTLNKHIMNAYADEPESWQEDPAWRVESPLRRKLCMQSIVATVTENCDVDSVVVLVEQQTVTDSLRLRERYYLTTEDASLLAEPLVRDDSLLLSPGTALHTILTCWQNRDWTRLERYVAGTIPKELAHLLDFSFTGPTLSPDGRTATFVLSGTLRRGGVDKAFSGHTLRLHRIEGRWALHAHQFNAFKED